MTAVAATNDAWTDRFTTPDWPTLAARFEDTQSALLELAHTKLHAIDGLTSTLEWHGPSWRWTLRFDGHGRTGLAYLIPRTERPQIGIPLPLERIADLRLKKLSKTVREPIEHAPVVAGTAWCEWDLSGKSVVDELCKLAAARAQLEVDDAPASKPSPSRRK